MTIAFFPEDEGKFLEKERNVKFFISLDASCTVQVNDSIKYSSKNLTSPIEHTVLGDYSTSKAKISPLAVNSEDLFVKYYGFSNSIKTFSTYFDKKTKKTDVTLNYDYKAHKLLETFSDFREEAYYGNINFNYNFFTWSFANTNYNSTDKMLNVEITFDLGNTFPYEDTYFSMDMKKSIDNLSVELDSGEVINKPIVRFEGYKTLNFNETFKFDVKFPLYFENCKNYTLNKLVVITGIIFFVFFIFVIYFTISIISND